MPSGTVPIWAKPKYIIPSFKCKFLLYHIIEPCYLRVAKQYQMVVRCSLAGICGFSCLATCFTTCKLLNYIVQLFVSLAQYSLSLLIAILHAFTRWVPTTVHRVSNVLNSLNSFWEMYLPVGFITTFWAEVHCPTCSDVQFSDFKNGLSAAKLS